MTPASFRTSNKVPSRNSVSGFSSSRVVVERVGTQQEAAEVYNLTIADYHTFFVGGPDWARTTAPKQSVVRGPSSAAQAASARTAWVTSDGSGPSEFGTPAVRS